MAPLFGSLDTMLDRLRLSGVCKTQKGAIDIIGDCVMRARMEMRRAFGASQFQTYSYLPDPGGDPITDDDYTFYTLRQLEDTIVERCLCSKLTQTALAGSAGSIEWFQQESPYRLMDQGQLDARCKRLGVQIADLFDQLNVLESYDPGGTPSSVTLGPECSPPLVQGLGSDIAPAPFESPPRYRSVL